MANPALFESAIQSEARLIRESLGRRFEPKIMRTQGIVTSVTRDSAQRVISAQAIIDGIPSQLVYCGVGSPVSTGDRIEVENRGGRTVPRWHLSRRIQTSVAVPPLDPDATLPTPTGLALTTGHYEPVPGGGIMAWIYVTWNTIADYFGYVGYDVAYTTNDQLDDPTILQIVDMMPTTALAAAITSTTTIIPRDPATSDYDFPRVGRIKIESEKIDYTAVTDGDGDTGSGTGSSGQLLDSGKSWDTNEWVNYCLIDSADARFVITSNTGTILYVSGTPASGSYAIHPCFSDCTRGAGSTSNVAHAIDVGAIRQSCGVNIQGLLPDIDYNVRVRAHRNDGAVSNWSAWSSIQTDLDTTAPPAPSDLDVDDRLGGVVLTWSAPTQDVCYDLAGFYVYTATDSSGTGASLVDEISPCLSTFYGFYPGTVLWFNLKAFDTSGNVSGYAEVTWLKGTSLAAGAQILSNSDFERNSASEFPIDVPDDWGWSGTYNSVSYGDYGRDGGKGIRVILDDGDAFGIEWPYTCADWKVIAEAKTYTASVYVRCTYANLEWKLFPSAGYVGLWCAPALHNGTSIWTITSGSNFMIDGTEELENDWYRMRNATEVFASYLSSYPYLAFECVLKNETGTQVTIYVDRPQLQAGQMTGWQPSLYLADGAAGGLSFDVSGIKTRDDAFWVMGNGTLNSDLIPSGDNDWDIGSASYKYASMYATTINATTVVATDYIRGEGGLRAGSSAVDPGYGNLSVQNNAAIDGYLTALGGIHVGGTSDPGDDILVVDSDVRVGGGVVVGSTSYNIGSGAFGLYDGVSTMHFLEPVPSNPGIRFRPATNPSVGDSILEIRNADYAKLVEFRYSAPNFFLDGLIISGASGDDYSTYGSKMTRGLLINQEGADDHILSFHSSDVAHGMTSLASTDCFGWFAKAYPTGGGLNIVGMKDADDANAIGLQLGGVIAETPQTTRGTTYKGQVNVFGAKISSTTWAEVGALENCISWSNLGSTRMIMTGNGNLYMDTTVTQNDWDEHDDLALMTTLRMDIRDGFKVRASKMLSEHRNILESTGVVEYNEKGEIWMSVQGMGMFTMDTLLQFAGRVMEKLTQYERALTSLGVDLEALPESVV